MIRFCKAVSGIFYRFHERPNALNNLFFDLFIEDIEIVLKKKKLCLEFPFLRSRPSSMEVTDLLISSCQASISLAAAKVRTGMRRHLFLMLYDVIPRTSPGLQFVRRS